MSEDADNFEPLPAEKLCNSESSNKPNPFFGDGALGNEKKGRMYYAGSDRKKLVETVQKMLKTLGYDLGNSGLDKNGVDGAFGDAMVFLISLLPLISSVAGGNNIIKKKTMEENRVGIGKLSALPSVKEQLATAKVVPGSAFEKLIKSNQDFHFLRSNEAHDNFSLPFWLRMYWCRNHHQCTALYSQPGSQLSRYVIPFMHGCCFTMTYWDSLNDPTGMKGGRP